LRFCAKPQKVARVSPTSAARRSHRLATSVIIVGMTSKELRAFFASHGAQRGAALILDERCALALIDKAQAEGVAVVGIDHFRTGSDGTLATGLGRAPALAVDRTESWRHAREFVGYFSGRGLLFEIELESPRVTKRAKVRDRVVPFDFWKPRFAAILLPLLFLIVSILIVFFKSGFLRS
jgi:hypothetical protein